MTVCFVSNSANDVGGSGSDITTAGYFDSTYVASAVGFSSPTSGSTPMTIGHDTTFVSQTITSFHWSGRYVNSNSVGSDGEWARWQTAAGKLMVYLDVSNGAFAIRVYNAAGGNTTSAYSFFLPTGTLDDYDVVYEDTGTTCTATLYLNGVTQISASVAASGAADLPKVMAFGHRDMFSSSGTCAMSQFICTVGETTVGMKLEELDAAGIGFHTDMSSTVTEINDGDRGTGWSSGTNTDKNSYTLPTYTVPAGRQIHSLNAQSVVRIGTTGPVNIRPFVRISSTDYDSAADFTPPQHQFGKHCASWVVDPATTVAWTAAGISATEVGFQVKT